MREPEKLLERCERATGPDYAIDLELACTYGPFVRQRYTQDGVPHLAFFERDKPIKGQWAFASGPETTEDRWHFLNTPRYTHSIDAAVALAEKVLPGWAWVVGYNDSQAECIAIVGQGLEAGDFEGEGVAPPLALLCAILRALLSTADARAPSVEEGEAHG